MVEKGVYYMSLNLNLEFLQKDNTWIVVPEGEIDIYTSPDLKKTLEEALDTQNANILIKGDKLEYIDSTGLGTLISIYKIVNQENNKIYLENIKPNIKKLFDITQLDKVFTFKE